MWDKSVANFESMLQLKYRACYIYIYIYAPFVIKFLNRQPLLDPNSSPSIFIQILIEDFNKLIITSGKRIPIISHVPIIKTEADKTYFNIPPCNY